MTVPDMKRLLNSLGFSVTQLQEEYRLEDDCAEPGFKDLGNFICFEDILIAALQYLHASERIISQKDLEVLWKAQSHSESNDLLSRLTRAVNSIAALTDPEGHVFHSTDACTGECRECRAVIAENEALLKPALPQEKP